MIQRYSVLSFDTLRPITKFLHIPIAPPNSSSKSTDRSQHPTQRLFRKGAVCFLVLFLLVICFVVKHAFQLIGFIGRIVGYFSPSCASQTKPAPTPDSPFQRTQEAQPTDIRFVCNLIWHLGTFPPSDPSEPFPFPRVDPTKPPFDQPEMMAHEWRPPHRAAGDKVKNVSFSSLNHDGMESWDNEEQIAILKDKIRDGGGDGGDFGLVHAVVMILREDGKRGVYMDHVDPVIYWSKKLVSS